MNKAKLWWKMMDSLRGDVQLARESFCPIPLAEFIAGLISAYSPKRILDPWSDIGLLVDTVISKTEADHCDVVIGLQVIADKAAKHLDKRISISCADSLSWLSNNDNTYDVVVSNPPFGMRRDVSVKPYCGASELRGDYAHLLLHESCKQLNSGGVAAFIMTPSFLSLSKAKKIRSSIQRMGIGFKACISIPAKTFYPYTNIRTMLVIFEKGYTGPLFVAQYSEDKKHQRTVINNLHASKEGKLLSLGRLLDTGAFVGYEALEMEERFDQLKTRIGRFSEVQFGSIVLETNHTKKGNDFHRLEERPNSVYLPLMATTKATTSQTQLPEKLKSYTQLVVDPEKANAIFVAGLLNTPLGLTIRDMSRRGITIPRISLDDLMQGPLYLPELGEQNEVSVVHSNINRMRNEINELESRLWSRPADVQNVAKSLSKMNKEDRFEDWVETLPFPLASIIWRYHGNKVSNSARESCETLIHFFEALGEFFATIHLSAICSDDGVKHEVMPQIKKVLDGQGQSIEMATFGTWKCLFEFLASKVRRGLNDNPDLYFDLYRTRDRSLLDMLLSKSLIGALQKTNLIRNGFAHGGAGSEATAKSSLIDLQQALDEVRTCFGETWLNYVLIDPGESKFRSGMTHYKFRRIVGTRNSPFRTSEVALSEQMEDGQLHLYCPGETRALPLLPFIKVMHSPKTEENACYFYNRRQGNGVRYLSYHFDSDSEIVKSFDDVTQIINSMTHPSV